MDFPSVSVVIRAYNAEKFITKCIDSIINQDYAGLIEIIICYDEGTKDKTLEKIVQYIKTTELKNNRTINIIRHTHTTPFRAMVHYGFLNARGDFIKPLDYDNYLPQNWISYVVKKLLESNASFGFSQALVVDEAGNILGNLGVKPEKPYDVRKLITKQYIDINEMIFKRECIEKMIQLLSSINHRFYDSLIDDWLYGLLALKICKPIFIENIPVYYIVHESNVFGGTLDSFEKRMLRLEANLKCLLAFNKIVDETRILTASERKLLRRTILRHLTFIISAINQEIRTNLMDYIVIGLWLLKHITKKTYNFINLILKIHKVKHF